jgi:hypothetical protein
MVTCLALPLAAAQSLLHVVLNLLEQRRGTPALFLAAYLTMGGAEVSLAGWWHLDGGAPWWPELGGG